MQSGPSLGPEGALAPTARIRGVPRRAETARSSDLRLSRSLTAAAAPGSAPGSRAEADPRALQMQAFGQAQALQPKDTVFLEGRSQQRTLVAATFANGIKLLFIP